MSIAKPGLQHYLISVALTKENPAGGDPLPGKVQTSVFTSDNPDAVFKNETFDNATGIITTELHSAVNGAPSVFWKGDADFGAGVSELDAQGGPFVFSDLDIEANSASMTAGEPVDNG